MTEPKMKGRDAQMMVIDEGSGMELPDITRLPGHTYESMEHEKRAAAAGDEPRPMDATIPAGKHGGLVLAPGFKIEANGAALIVDSVGIRVILVVPDEESYLVKLSKKAVALRGPKESDGMTLGTGFKIEAAGATFIVQSAGTGAIVLRPAPGTHLVKLSKHHVGVHVKPKLEAE